ncbi:MAG: sensor histidine kinase [Candidatus Thorarchaeota archaeon]
MKRIYSFILFSIPLIIIIPYFFPYFEDLTVYYKYMIFALTLINAGISIYFLIYAKEKDVRFFFILFGLSMFIYLLNTIFEIVEIYGTYPWEFFDNLSDFIGNLPILFLLVYRTFKDVQFLKRESRNIFLFGAIVASSGFLIVGLIASRLAIFVGIPMSDFYLYLPFLIEVIVIMILLMTLYIMYVELSFRYYILALLTGYIFSFIGDTYQLFYGLFGDVNYRGIARIFDLLAFSYFLVTLIWVRTKKIVVSSITEIEEERRKYKALYLELDDKVRDLLILTQFLRHDLGNDIVVVSNALELYKEKTNEDLFSMATDRLYRMSDRIQKLRSTSEIYESLKIQKLPITFVNDVARLFKKVDVKIKNKNQFIHGNQLLGFILFNLIDNSFKHGGENVVVKVEVDETDDTVIIKVLDNGIGMTDQQKQAITNYIPTIKETEGLPKGVGLSLAKNTVEGIGGEFKIEDNIPQGTIIIMEFKKYIEEEES